MDSKDLGASRFTETMQIYFNYVIFAIPLKNHDLILAFTRIILYSVFQGILLERHLVQILGLGCDTLDPLPLEKLD